MLWSWPARQPASDERTSLTREQLERDTRDSQGKGSFGEFWKERTRIKKPFIFPRVVRRFQPTPVVIRKDAWEGERRSSSRHIGFRGNKGGGRAKETNKQHWLRQKQTGSRSEHSWSAIELIIIEVWFSLVTQLVPTMISDHGILLFSIRPSDCRLDLTTQQQHSCSAQLVYHCEIKKGLFVHFLPNKLFTNHLSERFFVAQWVTNC